MLRVKQGNCVKTGAVVNMPEYGRVMKADVYLQGESIVVRFAASIHEGEWAKDEPANWTHKVLVGMRGFLLDGDITLAVVPKNQFAGPVVMPDGTKVEMVIREPELLIPESQHVERIRQMTTVIEHLKGVTLPIRTFNTGRTYSQHGQRIAWLPLKRDNATGKVVVAFHDYDRGITQVLEPLAPPLNEAAIMQAYDECRYDRNYGLPESVENALKVAAAEALRLGD